MYTNEELVRYSDIIVHGTLTYSYSFVEWYASGNIAVPSVYTVWTIKHSESFKGKNDVKTEFVVNGGTYNNIVQNVMHDTVMNIGDEVVVFLTKDPDSIYKDYYYMVGIESGIYKIHDGVIKNSYLKSSYDTNSFKETLRNQN